MRRTHRWVKIREHVYICRLCGTGRVNAQQADRSWVTTWHRPDGTSVVDTHVPVCQPGALTGRYLRHHQSALECSGFPLVESAKT